MPLIEEGVVCISRFSAREVEIYCLISKPRRSAGDPLLSAGLLSKWAVSEKPARNGPTARDGYRTLIRLSIESHDDFHLDTPPSLPSFPYVSRET